MMISQFENGSSYSERENSLLPSTAAGGVPGGGTFARLEFKAIEMPRRVIVGSEQDHRQESVSMQAEQTAAFEERTRSDEQRIAAEIESALAAGRNEGREEVTVEFERRVGTERRKVLRTCDEFRRERETYFATVEAGVVKLALAIAARVLHREVKLDPMLLQAVVKVALAKVMDESDTVLRVPMEDASAWRELMEAEDASVVTVSGDSRLEAGECVLETSVGRVELGVGAQLEEIEKGFFDLLQQRPV
jgi:flagellar assembly protein FliH